MALKHPPTSPDARPCRHAWRISRACHAHQVSDLLGRMTPAAARLDLQTSAFGGLMERGELQRTQPGVTCDVEPWCGCLGASLPAADSAFASCKHVFGMSCVRSDLVTWTSSNYRGCSDKTALLPLSLQRW